MPRNALTELPPNNPNPHPDVPPGYYRTLTGRVKPLPRAIVERLSPPTLIGGKVFEEPKRQWTNDSLCFVEVWGRLVEYFHQMAQQEKDDNDKISELSDAYNRVRQRLGISRDTVDKYFMLQTVHPTLRHADRMMAKFGLKFTDLLTRIKRPATAPSGEVTKCLGRLEDALTRVMALAEDKPSMYAPLGRLQRELDGLTWRISGGPPPKRHRRLRTYKKGQKVNLRYRCAACGFKCAYEFHATRHAEDVHGIRFKEFVGHLPYMEKE